MKVFGRQKISETKGEVVYLKTEGSHQLLELNFYEGDKPYKKGDEMDHLAFEVKDLDLALAFLARHGVKRVYEIVKSKKSRWTYVTDPDGIWIELFDHKPNKSLASILY
jgi:catechol 2,3-dioxygenase-like lactoylglutathione lyase family enzyme